MKTAAYAGFLVLAGALSAFPGWAYDTSAADRAASGSVVVVSVPWNFPSNHIDWLFNPTGKTQAFNPEWTWQLNRMDFWWALASAYRETRNEKYAEAFAQQLRDWLDQTGGVPPERNYNSAGSPWRTIEEGIRLMGSWPDAWAAFKDSPAFDAKLQARFLAAMRAQARHLMAHRTQRGNWLLMEMCGAYTFASRFPDYPECAATRRDSARIFADAIREQVLPDGLQYELSPDYHSVFYSCAAKLYELAKEYGRETELPADYVQILQRGAEGTLALTTPGMVQPRFNDCYTIPTKRVLERAARLFPDRADFRWGATAGRDGVPPAGPTASRFLPYAGFAVMRSSWQPDAAYLAFDVGPLGIAHVHQDKLSFTLWKGDQELVFDDGGGQYESSPERQYALSGYDHNTLLVDGLAQSRSEPRKVDAPIDAGWRTTTAEDFARGVYDQDYGTKGNCPVRHTREIVFDKTAEVFTITDTVESLDGKAHELELLFQLDTTKTLLDKAGLRLVADYGKRWCLEIKAVEGGVISCAVGQRELCRTGNTTSPRQRISEMAGWFIGRNDLKNHPATTASIKAPGKVKQHRFVTKLSVK